MKFKVGDKVICKDLPYGVMTIWHSGSMFDWSVINEDGQSNVYDEDELELYTEDKSIEKIVWHDTRVPKINLAHYLTELNLQPGKFLLLEDALDTNYIVIVFVKSEK